MGVKVNMNEVQNMKNAIKSELDKTNGDVDTLKESMSSLINTDQFKGATASSVKSYTRTFHYQSINKIKIPIKIMWLTWINLSASSVIRWITMKQRYYMKIK